jgi:hypothetical protein
MLAVHTQVAKDGTGTKILIGYLHIHNCRDYLLKFKPEQYTSQLKVMPLNFQPHTYL